MTERRKPKIQIGRRATDIPAKILEGFKADITLHLQEVIVKTVNGKIDNLRATVLTKEDFAHYVTADTQWKVDQEKKTEPVINGYKKGSDFIEVVKFLVGLIILIGAGVLAWVNIRNNIFK